MSRRSIRSTTMYGKEQSLIGKGLTGGSNVDGTENTKNYY